MGEMPKPINVKYSRPKSKVLSSYQASRFITDIEKSAWLEPFMAEPKTLTEAAKVLDVNLATYSYWIKQLLEHKLIFIAHQVKRAGKSIKYYWGTAESFVFPLSYMSIEDYYRQALEQYSQQFLHGFQQDLNDSSDDYFVEVSYDKQKEFVYYLRHKDSKKSYWEQKLAPDQNAMLAALHSLQLSFDDAKDLQMELYQLFKKYESKTNPKASHYLVQLTLAKAQK